MCLKICREKGVLCVCSMCYALFGNGAVSLISLVIVPRLSGGGMVVSNIDLVWEVIKEDAELDEEVWHRLGELLAQEGAEVVWAVISAVFEADGDIKQVILERLGCAGKGEFVLDDDW